jgi:MFS family permease
MPAVPVSCEQTNQEPFMNTSTIDTPQTAPHAGWALTTLALCTLLAALGTSSANVALPSLQQAFGAPFAMVQWVVLAYLLAITTLVVSAGKLGDLAGRKGLLLVGLTVFTMASAACAAAPTLGWLIGARALQGVGAAAMMALTMALVGDSVPREKAGSAMGLLGTMSAVGTALGPSLGGALVARYGWPAIFLLNVPLGMAALLLGYRFLPREHFSAAAGVAGFDHPGTVLLAITLGSYCLAMTTGHHLLLLVSGGVLVLFVLLQRRAAAPLIPLALFGDSQFRAGFAMSVLVTTVVMATLVVGPFYLTGALGLTAAGAGLAMSCGPLVSALAGIPAGRLVDRFGVLPLRVLGLTAVLSGCLLLAMLPISAGVTGYVSALALLTTGYALFQAANNTGVMAQVAAGQKGVAAGMLNLARHLGLISGAAMMGMLYTLRADAAAGMRLTFGCAAALSGAALLIAAARR